MTTLQTNGTVHLLGNLVHFLTRGTDTRNAYSLVEVTTAPGAGTPPHIQKADDEAFYVLAGRYEFLHGDQTITAGPGASILVRRGEAHAFRNVGDTPAKMLIINSPGGLHEGFFLEAGDAVDPSKGFPPAGAPDMPRLVTAANRFGIEFLPPAN
jgi:quercetin dioxygenase-like cupin family protein